MWVTEVSKLGQQVSRREINGTEPSICPAFPGTTENLSLGDSSGYGGICHSFGGVRTSPSIIEFTEDTMHLATDGALSNVHKRLMRGLNTTYGVALAARVVYPATLMSVGSILF